MVMKMPIDNTCRNESGNCSKHAQRGIALTKLDLTLLPKWIDGNSIYLYTKYETGKVKVAPTLPQK